MLRGGIELSDLELAEVLSVERECSFILLCRELLIGRGGVANCTTTSAERHLSPNGLNYIQVCYIYQKIKKNCDEIAGLNKGHFFQEVEVSQLNTHLCCLPL